MDVSDQQLVEAILEGNTPLFDVLVERHLSAVYNFAFRLTQNKDVAEDITQDTFIKVWKQLKKYNLEKSFKTWILSIAHNTTIDWFRKRKPIVFSQMLTGNEDTTFDETLADEEPQADEIFAQNENVEMVRKALDMLSPPDKAIVLLHLDEHLTFDEISELTHKPLNTIKSTYRRALIKLKKHTNAPK